MNPLSRALRATLVVCLLGLVHDATGFAAATTLYVKKSGNDTAPCTAAAPCKTIEHAVVVANPGDTIQVGPGLYRESDGIQIRKHLTIDGGWFLGTRVTPDTFSLTQVFWIAPGATVRLRGMTIMGASLGGIFNHGNLTLENVWIRENKGGGGIGNAVGSFLTLHNVGIDNNQGGAGLSNDGTALVSDSRIVGTSGVGPLRGNGVQNTGILIMDRGLIAGNEGFGLGQLSGSNDDCPAGTLLQNVTISGNSGRGVDAFCGEMILRHVTIAANTAEGLAGGLLVRSAAVKLENSILATNEGSQCGIFEAPASLSVSHSLIDDFSCAISVAPGNVVGFIAQLKALAPSAGESVFKKLFHVGANRAHALKAGSPAIDGGLAELCTDAFGGGFLTDQFGVQRPVDGDSDGIARCDMGAFEYKKKSVVRTEQ